MQRLARLAPLVFVFSAAACSDDARPTGVPEEDTGTVDTGTTTDSTLTDGTVVDSNIGDAVVADGDAVVVTDGGDTSVTTDGGDATATGDTRDATLSDSTLSDSTTAGDAATDTSVAADSSTSSDTAVVADTGPWPDANPVLIPVGNVCTTNAECDPTGAAIGLCSAFLYAEGTTDPTPTCITRSCLGFGGLGSNCGAGGKGICVAGGSFGRCLPECTFHDDVAAPTGCTGKNVCNSFRTSRDSLGAPLGRGYCQGGCTADSDCSGGDKCQIEFGLCVKTPVVYPKTVGASCTSASECSCLLVGQGGSGYCTRYCKTGGTACPSGFVCDPDLPSSDSTGTLFTKVPVGLGGSCYKTCTSDADCSPLGAHCAPVGTSTGVRTCRAGL